MYLLLKFACEVPNPVAWPLFKANIVSAWSEPANPLARKASLKVLGFVSESDALLDCIKDDIDELTDLLVMALKDPNDGVRDAGALTCAEFADNVIPDFLEEADKILPCLLEVLTQRLEMIYTTVSAGGAKTHGESAEKALLALAEFTANMEMDSIRPYTAKIIEVCLTCISKPEIFETKIRFAALNTLSACISGSEHLVFPFMT